MDLTAVAAMRSRAATVATTGSAAAYTPAEGIERTASASTGGSASATCCVSRWRCDESAAAREGLRGARLQATRGAPDLELHEEAVGRSRDGRFRLVDP